MDRKYGHRGYQDKDRDRDRSSTVARDLLQPPKEKPEGPRGRTVGREAEQAFKCNKCGERVQSLDELGAEAACLRCAGPLHTCSHCTFYDTSTRFECRKDIAARITRKHEANSCDQFSPRLSLDLTGPKRPQAAPDDARALFEKMFGK